MTTVKSEDAVEYSSKPMDGDSVIQLAIDTLRSRLRARSETKMLSPEDTRRFIQLRIAHFDHEVFAVLFLNSKHELIEDKIMFRGTLTTASVHPREIVKEVMRTNADAVILAHNHPSGHAAPSSSDLRLTQNLVTALKAVEVRVLDHIICGGDNRMEIHSFAEAGLL